MMEAEHLTEDEHLRWMKDGFFVRPSVFSSAEMTEVVDAFDRLEALAGTLSGTSELDGTRFVLGPRIEGGKPIIRRIVWCGGREPELLKVSLDARLLGPVRDLLATSTADQLVHQAHYKMPGDNVAFGLHQDAWNRRYGTALWRGGLAGDYVQVLLTVDDMREDNGPLLIVPGSHLTGPVLGLDRETKLATLRPRATAITAPSGSLVFFGPFLVHGSEPNEGSSPRRALVSGFARPGVNRRRYPGAGLGVRRRLPGPQSLPAS